MSPQLNKEIEKQKLKPGKIVYHKPPEVTNGQLWRERFLASCHHEDKCTFTEKGIMADNYVLEYRSRFPLEN